MVPEADVCVCYTHNFVSLCLVPPRTFPVHYSFWVVSCLSYLVSLRTSLVSRPSFGETVCPDTGPLSRLLVVSF